MTTIMRENTNLSKQGYEDVFRQSFLKVDELLELDEGKKELLEMKKQFPPNNSPMLKILGETVGNGSNSDSDPANDFATLDSIGCTANCLMIRNNQQIVVGNAGDSWAVLSRGGKAVALSEDHKPENEGERRRIEKAGSYIAEGRVDGNLNLSRSLGDLKYKKNKAL
jgi:serine/threonine protein phosphatase PrpC